VTRLAPERVQSQELGFRTAGAAGGDARADAVRWESRHARDVVALAEDESLVLTGDGQLVELSATAQYRLDTRTPQALKAYAFGTAEADTALRPLIEAALREIASRRPLDAFLTASRRDVEQAARALIQERIDAYGLGLLVVRVDLQDVHPPLPVVDAYRDVSRAESDRQRRINEGRTARAETLAAARGRAAATLSRAEADRQAQVARAAGEAEAFEAEALARGPRPALADHRRYWDTVSDVLAGKPKLVIDAEPDRVRNRHLIVPSLPLPLLDAARGEKAPLDTRPLQGPPP
jgi:membrane protease subunit HflK